MRDGPRYCVLAWDADDPGWELLHYGISLEEVETQVKRFEKQGYQRLKVFLNMEDLESEDTKQKSLDILANLLESRKNK